MSKTKTGGARKVTFGVQKLHFGVDKWRTGNQCAPGKNWKGDQ